MRFIGRCYNYLERYDEAILWYKKAIKEAPYLRDPYVELALLYHKLNKNNKVITKFRKVFARKIQEELYYKNKHVFIFKFKVKKFKG